MSRPTKVLPRKSHGRSANWLDRLVRRFTAACHTNETQFSAVAMFSLLMMIAAIKREGAPWWFVVAAGAFWPIVAFVLNFIDPIPK